jgi:hypothetical protein
MREFEQGILQELERNKCDNVEQLIGRNLKKNMA